MTENRAETIGVKNLGFWRGSRKVLDGVSCSLKEGTLTALIGHNGAGKSKTFSGCFTPQRAA
jgi:ABC-type Mn2+/Zn2+ transport system ATPase subunit